MNPQKRLKELNLQLPKAPNPKGIYKAIQIQGNLAYVSGHTPLRQDGTLILGKVGSDLTLEQGKTAARQVGLAILATLKSRLGSLDRISRLIKVLGMVNSTADFFNHPKVIDGCSELFKEVFGIKRGVGARSAIGTASLPGNIAVEIEAIFEISKCKDKTSSLLSGDSGGVPAGSGDPTFRS